MKTFAYLALIGTTLAIRLTESTGAVDGAVTEQATLEQQELEAFGQVDLEQLGSLTVEDLGEDAALCLRDATRGVLVDAGLEREDVDRVDEALTAGALERDAEGNLKNDLSDFRGALDQVGRQMGGDTDDIESGLEEIARRSLDCLRRKEERRGAPGGGQGPAGGEGPTAGEGTGPAPETTLAQGVDAAADLPEEKKKELKKAAKKAAEELGLTKEEADAVA